MNLNDASTRVARGAEYLDLKGPDEWADRIDPDRLDLDDGDNCILGQLYGCYWEGLVGLGLNNHIGTFLGYQLWEREDDEDYAKLKAAWLWHIRERKHGED